MKLKTLFMGTPDFSVPSLDLLSNHPAIDLSMVVSMPDRAIGRSHSDLKSPEVIEFAKAKNIPFFQTTNINKEAEFLNKIDNENYDLIIVLAFAQFLGKKVLNLPRLGCFNIHTSLLPKYRGAAPIQYALLNGDKSTGVSIQKMVKKMDAGDLVHSFPIDVAHNETGGQLYTRLKFQAALSLNLFIDDLLNNKVTFEKQNEEFVSFAPVLTKEDGFLDFKNSNFDKIHNQIRALDPWPGTWCMLGKKRLKVFSIEGSSKKLKAGEVFTSHQELLIGLKDKTIRLKDIQLEGKKRTTDFDLLQGYRDQILINE